MKNYKKSASLRKFMVHRKFAKKGTVQPKMLKSRYLLNSESKFSVESQLLIYIRFISILLNGLSKDFLAKSVILSQVKAVSAKKQIYCYFSTLAGGKYVMQSDWMLSCYGFNRILPLCNATIESTGVISKLVIDLCADDKIMALNDSIIFNISLDEDLQCVVDRWCAPGVPFALGTRGTLILLGVLSGICLCIYSIERLRDGGCKIAVSNLGRYISGNRQRFYPVNNQIVQRDQKRIEEDENLDYPFV